MSFEEFWEGQGEPLASDAAVRATAMMAWDAALCAVQDRSFDRGRLRSNHEMAAILSDLHTWAKPATQPTP